MFEGTRRVGVGDDDQNGPGMCLFSFFVFFVY